MAGTPRTRVRKTGNGSAGLATWYTSVIRDAPPPNVTTVHDVVGNPKGDNPFELTRTKINRLGRVNGSSPYLGYERKLIDHVPSCVYTGACFPNASPSGDLSQLNRKVANGHPGSSDISIPNFLFELKDVPGMLMHAGRRAKQLSHSLGNPSPSKVDGLMFTKRRTAEDWLNYNFGWVPFFSDIDTLDKISADTQSHFGLLSKISERGYISRSAKLGTTRVQVTDNKFPYDSAYRNHWAKCVTVTTTKRWATTKWLTDSYDMRNLRKRDPYKNVRHRLGLDLSFENIWNAMPWSWLVDYFTDIADIVKIRNDRFGIRYQSTCLMTHVVARRIIMPYPSVFLCGDVIATRESKKREVLRLSQLPTASMRFLGKQQLANLSALLVTRTR